MLETGFQQPPCLRTYFTIVWNFVFQPTEKASFSESSEPSPRGRDPQNHCNQGSYFCMEEPHDSSSLSLSLTETPEVLNAEDNPFLKQLEDEWSEDDLSATKGALQEDTAKESPWRLKEISGEATNSNLSDGSQSWIESNPNLGTDDNLLDTALTNRPCVKKMMTLTNNEDKMSEQIFHLEDNTTEMPDRTYLNLNSSVTNEMMAGRVCHSKRGKWVCSICNKNYTTLKALKKHISVHYGGRSKCFECPATFDDEEALTLHETKHSSSSLYLGHSCQHCLKTYRMEHLLEQHIAAEHTHSNNGVTMPKEFHEKCGKCAKVFHSSIEMEIHDESCGFMHSEEESADEISTRPLAEWKDCYLCKLNFKSIPQLTYHLKKFHNEDPTFKCETCEKVFDNFPLLSNHRSKVHIVKHICEYCQKTFREKPKLRRHINTVHTENKPYKCDICSHSFKRIDVLKSHYNTHSKPFQCDKCSLKFRSKTQLDVHENVVHLGIKHFMCDRCGETFLNRTRLKHHVTKSTLLNLKCEVCEESFCIKQLFQRHIKLHTSTKLHICNQCDSKFLSKKGLCSHMKLKHSP